MNSKIDHSKIKSILKVQKRFRYFKNMCNKLDIECKFIYKSILNISTQLQKNYDNGIISKGKFGELIEIVNPILEEYKKIPSPLTINSLLNKVKVDDLIVKIKLLEFKLIDICKNCGMKCCSDILTVMINKDWKKMVTKSYRELVDFYDSCFIPIRCNIINEFEKEIDILEPFVKKNLNIYKMSFIEKINGADIYFPFKNKLLYINGYFKNDPLNIIRMRGFLDKKYYKTLSLAKYLHIPQSFKELFLEQLPLRDFLINDEKELVKIINENYEYFIDYKDKPISLQIKEFVSAKSEIQRKILTLFLISDKDDQIIAHIIYNMISNKNENMRQNSIAENIYKSLPWCVQKKFKIAFRNIEKRKEELKNLNESDIPYEQRISIMKAPDYIKSKAMEKLKESKGSRESSVKALQYLDTILKIPFNIYKEEEIIQFLNKFTNKLKNTIPNLLNKLKKSKNIDKKYKNNLISILEQYDPDKHDTSNNINIFIEELNKFHCSINYNIKRREIRYLIRKEKDYSEDDTEDDTDYDTDYEDNYNIVKFNDIILNLISEWMKYKKEKKLYLEKIDDVMNNCIHGQNEAKKQIKRLIAQWINGKSKGAVFGFEGVPGCGKTSLAKRGLAKCLVDKDGKERPFIFIPLGGSTDGATLQGHSYTYLGSTWGNIVDGLIASKCMNPIIFFDELDKVSNTQHGNEIIGILDHLTDSTQNSEFTDRYFSGIKFDLSKALIIFTYNNRKNINPILLDRITEINFKALTKYDKIVINDKFILPENLNIVGFKNDDITFEKNALEYLIDTYTNEGGVRKLKEKLIEIIRELNIQHMMNEDLKLPYKIDKKFIKNLFIDKPKINLIKIHKKPCIGIVNGLYATDSGTGGILPIEAVKTPSESKFKLTLTGSLGKVMTESISCSKTLALSLLPKNIFEKINNECKENTFGIHINGTGASTPKEGPSAGSAITTVIISLLTGIAIKNDIAMTGEVNLYGTVHAIGGLEAKLEGARKAGVKLVLVPKENEDDYNKIKKRYNDNGIKLIDVVLVENINDVIKYALVENDIEFRDINN